MGKKSEKKVEEPIKAKTKSSKPVSVPAKPAKAAAVVAKAAPAAVPAKKAAASPAKMASAKSGPTHEQIRTQAYYVAEKRRAAGLPGDAASDWIQAEKELLAAQK